MRKRKHIIWATVVLVCLTVASFIIPAPDPPSVVSKENFERIQEGMKLDEVEAMLGPPGRYNTRPTSFIDARTGGSWNERRPR